MKTLHHSILSSNEVYTSAIRFDTIISGNITNDPFITMLLPLLRVPVANLAVSIGRTTDSKYVRILADKDLIRDTRYLSLRGYCNGFVNDIDPAKAAAAQAIVDVFHDLGWSMHVEGYARETSLLASLIVKMETTLSGPVTVIDATSRVANLKVAHLDFEDTFNNKVDGKTKEEYPKIVNCRKTIARYLGALLSYIDIMAEVKGLSFSTAASQIDEVIVEFESMARARQTKNTKETKDS